MKKQIIITAVLLIILADIVAITLCLIAGAWHKAISIFCIGVILLSFGFYVLFNEWRKISPTRGMTPNINDLSAMYDSSNTFGVYRVEDCGTYYQVQKGYIEDGVFWKTFSVRSFHYDPSSKKQKSASMLRAYSLLNHITDNGKLWRTEERK